MSDILDSVAAQLASGDGNVKAVLKQLEHDVVKQMPKDQLVDKLVQVLVLASSGDALSEGPTEQLKQAERYSHAGADQGTVAKVLLAILLLAKLQHRLSAQEKHDALLFVYTNHANSSLHLQTLQVLLRSFNQQELAQNVFILLQYFALASQQMSGTYLCLFNAVSARFAGAGDWYSALEFLRRNQTKAVAALRLHANAPGAETDAADFHYRAALVTAAAGQYSNAAAILKRCDIRLDQKYQELHLLLQILTLQDFEYRDAGSEFYNKIQLYYLNSHVRYFRKSGVDYVSLDELRDLVARARAGELGEQRALFLVRAIGSDAFAARLQVKYLEKIYRSVKVGPGDFEGVALKDVGVGADGMLRFGDTTGLYKTSAPRRTLLEQLGRRVEQQKMTALRNVRPEEAPDEQENESDDDLLLDDLFDYYSD